MNKYTTLRVMNTSIETSFENESLPSQRLQDTARQTLLSSPKDTTTSSRNPLVFKTTEARKFHKPTSWIPRTITSKFISEDQREYVREVVR